MNKLEESISALDYCLKEYCSSLYQRLLNPLEKEKINKLLQQIGVDDSDLEELYLWKNGILNDGSLPTHSFDYTSFGVIPPLEYAVMIYQMESENDLWSKSLIPIVSSYAGDFLLFESDKNSKTYGMIYLYSPTLGYVYDLVTYFDSLESMISTTVESFRAGAFTYNNKEMVFDVSNQDMQFSIAAELNPRSEYWDEYR